MRVILGIGCDRDVSLATLADAVVAALAEAGLASGDVAGVASIDLKRTEPALSALARQGGWPLLFYPASALATVAVPHPSETVRRYTGAPAVAEAAAIYGAGGSAADLVTAKRRWRGADGRHATISIARLMNGEQEE